MVETGDSVPGTVTRDNTLILFDVDGTLTPARRRISVEMSAFLESLQKRVSVGLVGGSDLKKIAEQMLPPSLDGQGLDAVESCVKTYDYVFSENGLVAFHNGQHLSTTSLKETLGEDKLQKFINFCLGYMSKINLPVKRGNFVEFRNGLINICPVGRSCSQEEREQFNAYDNEHKIREKFIEELRRQFGPASGDDLGLEFVIGGQISFDVFPRGWDKTYCLKFVRHKFKDIYFFGDKTQPGGNDHAIFAHETIKGFSVKDPEHTMRQIKNLGL